jgi:hypothetical protein
MYNSEIQLKLLFFSANLLFYEPKLKTSSMCFEMSTKSGISVPRESCGLVHILPGHS